MLGILRTRICPPWDNPCTWLLLYLMENAHFNLFIQCCLCKAGSIYPVAETQGSFLSMSGLEPDASPRMCDFENGVIIAKERAYQAISSVTIFKER